jgi:hypothetical protein
MGLYLNFQPCRRLSLSVKFDLNGQAADKEPARDIPFPKRQHSKEPDGATKLK